jgi:hypothetical protein
VWSQRQVCVVTKTGLCGHKDRSVWSQRQVCVVTKTGLCGHKDRYVWSQRHKSYSDSESVFSLTNFKTDLRATVSDVYY